MFWKFGKNQTRNPERVACFWCFINPLLFCGWNLAAFRVMIRGSGLGFWGLAVPLLGISGTRYGGGWQGVGGFENEGHPPKNAPGLIWTANIFKRGERQKNIKP